MTTTRKARASRASTPDELDEQVRVEPTPVPPIERAESFAASSGESLQAPPERFEADVFPDFAVSPEEVTRRTRELQSYVREHMREGEDYGVIPGANKPTLFKPGAEKLNAVFGLSPIVEVNNRIEDWDSGFVAYEVKVTLINKRSGGIEADGIGSCNSRERRYKNQDAAGIANTVLKMAKKRALIDATLSATRASGMFTQDLEDIDFDDRAPARSDQRGEGRAPERFERGGERFEREPADPITEAQQRAVIAIATRVFGRHSRDEDIARLAGKPLESLSKGEASALIDRLRSMLTEDERGSGAGSEMNFSRAGRNGAR